MRRVEGLPLYLALDAVRRVLAIGGMIASATHKAPRYRGSTERQPPRAVLG